MNYFTTSDLVPLSHSEAEEASSRVGEGEQRRQLELCSALFEDSRLAIGADDVPFLGWSGCDVVLALLEEVAGEEPAVVKKKIREEIRRWHPDKFRQKLGHRIDKLEFLIVMERVKSVSQALNDYGK